MSSILEDLTTIDVIERELQRDRRTIVRWSRERGFPYVQLGCTRYYRVSDVRDWVLAQSSAVQQL